MPIILKRSVSIDNHENLTDAQKEVVYSLLIRFRSRMKELDSKNNIWGTDHFFSDQEIYNHYIDAVKDINTGNPRTSFSLYELKKVFDIELPEGDYETLSGYLLEKLGRIPNENEYPVIEDENLTYKIEKMEDKRIKYVKVCRNLNEETI